MALDSPTVDLVNGDTVDPHAPASNKIPLDSGRDILDSVDPLDDPTCLKAEETEPQRYDARKHDLDLSAVSLETHDDGIASGDIPESNFANKGFFRETTKSRHGEPSRDVGNSDTGVITRRRSIWPKLAGSKMVKGVPSNIQTLESRLGLAERKITELESKIATMSTTATPWMDKEFIASESGSTETVAAEQAEGILNSVSIPPCMMKDLRLGITVIDFKQWLTRTEEKLSTTIFDVSLANYLENGRIPAQVKEARGARVAPARQSVRDEVFDFIDSTLPNDSPKSEVSTGSKVLVRLGIRSPWIEMLLYQLAGWSTERYAGILVRPFKPIVAYERQIRKYAEILDNTSVTITSNKELVATLKNIWKEAFVDESSGPDNEEINDSDIFVRLKNNVLLQGHFDKIDDIVSRNENPASEVSDDSETEKSRQMSMATGLDREAPKFNGFPKETSKDGDIAKKTDEGIPTERECTCLKDAKDHIRLLVQLMDEYLSDLITIRRNIVSGKLKKIAFKDLWLLYQTGDLVVSSRSDRQAYRVVQVSGGRPLMAQSLDLPGKDEPYVGEVDQDSPDINNRSRNSPFTINLVNLESDGQKLGPVQHQVIVREFDDEIAIRKLEVYPLNLAKDSNQVKEDLVERGKFFVTLAKIAHMRHSGLSFGEPQEEVESEIITDFALALRQPENSSWRPKLGLINPTNADLRELFECCCRDENCRNYSQNDIFDDTSFDKRRKEAFLSSAACLRDDILDNQELSDDQLILLPTRIFAFALRTRKWVSLNINQVQRIEQEGKGISQKTGLDDIVIPEDYKAVLKAMVFTHSVPKVSSGLAQMQSKRQEEGASHEVDLIKGKGRGLIILLHGVPGVGKTTTAESVAAHTGKPLFPITCGDIGQTADVVESKLESLFLLARKWDCVLLLDEADVFLAKRERGDIKRNALVSVFLRVLEYYSGILFLTTNRVGEFDEAFKSRIHLSLLYPELDKENTRKVWEMNLDRITRSKRNIGFSKDRILEFAEEHWTGGGRWNGRQIRNAFQTAIALAEYEYQEECRKSNEEGSTPPQKPKLQKKQFAVVAKTSAKFDRYLISVMGGDSFATRAKTNEIRADGFKDATTGSYGPKAPRASRSSSQRVAPSIANSSLRGAGHGARGQGKPAARLREAERAAEENRRRQQSDVDFDGCDGYDDELDGEAEEGEEEEDMDY